MDENIVALHRFIVDFFSLGELENLCFSLFVDHENFESRGKEAKARELVLFMQRRGRLPDLHSALARERPEMYRERFGRVQTSEVFKTSEVSLHHNPQQIFISHAHEDAEFARRLAADLRADGRAVWIAPESIRPGERWVEAINRGLEESGIFVVVLTPAAVASRWVNTETNLAIGLEHSGRLRFIPLEVEACRPPLLWTAYQSVPFRHQYAVGIADLRARLGKGTVQNRFIHQKSGIEFIRIPAGDFLYGEEKQTVYLPEYWIGRAPVTNEQYARFVADVGYEAPNHWKGKRPPAKLADHPVIYVSWDDAQAYCKWAGLRLPTEEEWEKAARGTDGREYPWGDKLPNARLCNFKKNVGTTTPVGRYSPQGDSPYGCVDMAGNVWEWTDSANNEHKDFRVLRGGSWYPTAPFHMQGTHRFQLGLGSQNHDGGFRVGASIFPP